MRYQPHFPLVTIFMTNLLFSSCQVTNRTGESVIAGHFENSDAKALAKFKDKQCIVPEYEPTRGVVSWACPWYNPWYERAMGVLYTTCQHRFMNSGCPLKWGTSDEQKKLRALVVEDQDMFWLAVAMNCHFLDLKFPSPRTEKKVLK